MIRSIFAVDASGGIGKDGTLPWPKDREDMDWFRTNTVNGVVVMGRNTWDDPLMLKPLPKRYNVVVTSKDLSGCDAAHRVIPSGLEQNLLRLSEERAQDIWIIGGARLLETTQHLIQEAYVTRFDQSYGCDVKLDTDRYLHGFRLVREIPATGKVFQVYEKLS